MNDPGMDGEMEETEKINVVPLADLTLVLLIILMVISPMISQSLIRVSTPQVKTGAGAEAAGPEAKKEEGPLRVDIRENGFLLNDKPFEILSALLENLRQRLAADPERMVLVSADESVVVRRVVEVLDGAKLAGARSLSLAGLKKKVQEKRK
jgi:biopolymer transport protein ExbD